MVIERTFSMIKPDATRRNLTGAITRMLEEAGLRVVASKRVWMSRREAEGFYAVHRERPFFGELVEFMSSGPTVVQVLEGENAIARNREVMGATNPANAAEGTIRKVHSLRSARIRCTAPTLPTPPPWKSVTGSRRPRSSAESFAAAAALRRSPQCRRCAWRPPPASRRRRNPEAQGRARKRIACLGIAMLLGAVADDFTGASDLANTLARGGMATVQFVGPGGTPVDCEAGVVALKTRSRGGRGGPPVGRGGALAAEQGCRQILFKYCSTFDSTPEGNIGPVAEALLEMPGARWRWYVRRFRGPAGGCSWGTSSSGTGCSANRAWSITR